MKASELLNHFTEKSFTDVWEEKIKNIISFHPQIDETQVKNFKNNIKKIFELDEKIKLLKKYLEVNIEIEISENDYDSILKNGISIINTINGLFNNANYVDLSKKDLFSIFQKLYEELTINSFLVDIYEYTPRGSQQLPNGKKRIDNNIERLDTTVRIIKLENKNEKSFNSDDLDKIQKIIKQTSEFDTKYPDIIKKINSFLEYEKEVTKKEVSKIGEYYNNKGEEIKLYNEKVFKFFIKWKNSDWIGLSIIFGEFILLISYFNIIKEGKMIVSTLPLIATVSIFIIFFLKQYSNNKNLINSYEFKGISAEVMEHLLGTRENTEEGKIILEKTLDKILEDPSKNDKGTNETINLINTSLKTPGN